MWSTLFFGDSQVRSGYLVIGILKNRGLRNNFVGISDQFDKIKIEQLMDKFDEITEGSPENSLRAQDGFQVGGGAAPGEASGAMGPAAMGKEEALQQFCVDMTEQARQGEIDSIVGRDEEIRQIVDILMRRRQNNPILTGEAGVGKTAVVEGFAARIAKGDVPPPLQGVRLLSLDIGLAAGRRQHEGRVREPASSGHRGSSVLGQTDHPFRRRSAHLDRRRWSGRNRRCGQPAEAGVGARATADHRGHDLGRVQEAHRKRPRVDPSFSGRAGAGAE